MQGWFRQQRKHFFMAAVASVLRQRAEGSRKRSLAFEGESAGQIGLVGRTGRSPKRHGKIYTIFEGTSEIQRLVIARAITGRYIR